jgi:hypothetical protein
MLYILGLLSPYYHERKDPSIVSGIVENSARKGTGGCIFHPAMVPLN